MHTDFEYIVKDTIKKYKMLDRTERIVVGFSGGADSVSLLYFLNEFIKESNCNIELIPIHVNHGIRGEEAEQDEVFAKNFCDELGLSLTVFHEDVKKIAHENKISVEEAGRNVRYKIFGEYAVGDKSKIAVAHTLSDNCETVLFNLTRGTSLKGLCGIPPTRDNIIRPLIDVTRGQIESYCKGNGLKYVNDSTNFEREYTRNKLRLDIIPQLKSINPSFESAVGRLSIMLRDNEEFADSVAQEILDKCRTKIGYDTADIIKQNSAIKSRIAYKILSEYFAKPVENKHVDELIETMERGSGAVNISQRLSVKCENNRLFINEIVQNRDMFWKVKMKIGRNFLTAINNTVIINVVSADDFRNMQQIGNKRNLWFIDYDGLPKECYFRCRRSGDKFTFFKRGITKSLKKIFNESKTPIDERSKIPILATDNEVIWINRIGVSKNYIPTSRSENVLVLELEDNIDD